VTERVIMAGFGGQGMMLIGKTYAGAAMHAGKEVTFFPSYGAEVRGGTAHCHVVVSDDPIYSPMVEVADSLIIMNQPSYEKFRPRLRPEGLLLLNSSMTDTREAREAESAAQALPIPATELANELGNVRVANVIMLGAYAALRHSVPAEVILAELEKGMTGRKAGLLEVNRKAFQKGAELAAAAHSRRDAH